MVKRIMGFVGAACVGIAIALTPAHAKTKQEKAERLIEKAAATVNYFSGDSAYEALWETADNAKAMVIIPRSLRGGFIFGASGGNAVMVARQDDGAWTEPTFFTIGSISFGLQIGGEQSETVLLVMTKRGMEQLLSTSVKLGGDLSLAVGPIGGGAKAQTADVIAFSRSRGLYGGISLEGAVLKNRHGWNRAYYNADVSPADIVYREEVANPLSRVLKSAVWTLAHRDNPVTLAPLQPADGYANEDGYAGEVGQPVGALIEDPVVFEDDAVYGAPLAPIDDN